MENDDIHKFIEHTYKLFLIPPDDDHVYTSYMKPEVKDYNNGWI